MSWFGAWRRRRLHWLDLGRESGLDDLGAIWGEGARGAHHICRAVGTVYGSGNGAFHAIQSPMRKSMA